MKKIISILLFTLLSGCSVIQPMIDRFTIAPFDNNEYAMVNLIRTTAIQTKLKCETEDFLIFHYVNEIYDTALLLKNYSQYLPKNEQSIKPINLAYQMVNELKTRYEKETKVSKTYCELKLQSIIDVSESIQQAIGKRPRP